MAQENPGPTATWARAAADAMTTFSGGSRGSLSGLDKPPLLPETVHLMHLSRKRARLKNSIYTSCAIVQARSPLMIVLDPPFGLGV